MWKILLLSSFLLSMGAKNRVQSLILKEDSPLKINLYAGRVSLIKLPCSPYKALIGSPLDVSVHFDEGSKEIHLSLKKFNAQPTNLIIKCSKKTLIFDIMPSKTSHNDFIEILSVIQRTERKKELTRKNAPSQTGGGLLPGLKIRNILKSSKELK